MSIAPHKLEAALAALPAGIAGEMHRIVSSPDFRGVIGAAQASALAAREGASIDQVALLLLPLAALFAHAPVSDFVVGAVSVGLSKALYFGANLEVVGRRLGVTVHAEQAAVANAWTNGETGLSALAVSAAPCGFCRQFLNELEAAESLAILLPGQRAETLAKLLPGAFGPKDLGIETRLMQREHHHLKASQALDDTGRAALDAANASYSPYTRTFAGLALRLQRGAIVSGRYAENAAYNPSLSAVGAALSQLALSDQPFSDIAEAVLVEAPGKASQADFTREVLGGICRAPLAVYPAMA